jgi:rubredoxin
MIYIENPYSSLRRCPKCTGQYYEYDSISVKEDKYKTYICKSCNYIFKAVQSYNAIINAPLSEYTF